MIGRSARTLALALSGVMALSGAVGAQDLRPERSTPQRRRSRSLLPISVLLARPAWQ